MLRCRHSAIFLIIAQWPMSVPSLECTIMVPTIETGVCTTAMKGGQGEDYLQHISPYNICVLAYNEQKVTFCKHVSNLRRLSHQMYINVA